MTVFAVYAGIFVLITSVVAIGYQQPQQTEVASVAKATAAPAAAVLDDPSVDKIVATNIAANFAEQTNMPIAANVANLTVSLAAKVELAQTSEVAISKPQIIQPTAAIRDITTYVAKEGDTTTSVAAAYGVSVETIRWANNLTGDSLDEGKTLTIPPVDGVVYTVKSGDTAKELAETYKADESRIISFNDLEITGLSEGTKIVIPAGVLPETQRPGYTAPRATVAPLNNGLSGGGGGYTISRGLAGVSSGNKYAFGNCTYYAYERRAQMGRPIGSFWGNAATWAMYARAAGFTVNNTPAVGAIMQNGGGYGHVAIVEEVFSNGDIRISEMNYYGGGGGFNIVSGRTVSAGQASAFNYIH